MPLLLLTAHLFLLLAYNEERQIWMLLHPIYDREKNIYAKIFFATGWTMNIIQPLYYSENVTKWSIFAHVWVNVCVCGFFSRTWYHTETLLQNMENLSNWDFIIPLATRSTFVYWFERASKKKYFNQEFNKTPINGLFPNVSQINGDEAVKRCANRSWSESFTV